MEKEKKKSYDKVVRNVLFLLLCIAIGFTFRGGARLVSSRRIATGGQEREKPCVIIDAGHGGADPGKVGVDGSLEKDINLKIAKKLAAFLTAADVDVVLTRETYFVQVSGYTVEETPYASGNAGYKDWFILQYDRPGYTIEAGYGENPLPIEDFPDIYRRNTGILTGGMTQILQFLLWQRGN